MLKSFLSGLTIGGVGAVIAMQYHLVRTNERMLIVPRIHQPPLRSAYVDVRHWSAAMWEHYPELSEAMVKSGHTDLIDAAGETGTSSKIYESSHQTQVRPAPIPHEAQAPAQLAQNSPQPKHPEIVVPVPNPMESTPEIASTIPNKPPIAVKIPQTALPELQMPVPCPVEMQASTEKKGADKPPAPKTQQGWMTHLLKAIVPQGASAIESSMAPTSDALDLIPEQTPAKPEPVQQQTEFPMSPRRIGSTEPNAL